MLPPPDHHYLLGRECMRNASRSLFAEGRDTITPPDVLDAALRLCDCDVVQRAVSMALHCEPFPFVHPIWLELFYSLLFYGSISLAIVGNCIVIWIVVGHSMMRTVTNYYLLNLAIADTTISIFNTSVSWSYNFYYMWRLGDYCAVNNMMGITPICASVFTMIVMSVDRYVAIVHPLRRRPGRRATLSIILAIWVLALLCGLPALLTSHIQVNYFWNGSSLFANPVCLADAFPDGDASRSAWFARYTNALAFVEYLIPLGVLSLTYWRVGLVLRRSAQIGDRAHRRADQSKRKAANMLGLVVLAFMLLWFPYNAYFVLSNWIDVVRLERRVNLFLYLNIYWLGMSTALFNPLIYYFMNKRFRAGFRFALSRLLPCVPYDRCDYERLLLGSDKQPATIVTSTRQGAGFPCIPHATFTLDSSEVVVDLPNSKSSQSQRRTSRSARCSSPMLLENSHNNANTNTNTNCCNRRATFRSSLHLDAVSIT